MQTGDKVMVLQNHNADTCPRYVFQRVFVADGNFKADHVHVKTPSHDIWLSEGGGMVLKHEEYLTWLKMAMEKQMVSFTVSYMLFLLSNSLIQFFAPITLMIISQQKASCENTFRAISNSLIASNACDITGIISIACAQHGCYAPNAIVDLFKGEQQKNVDFALL